MTQEALKLALDYLESRGLAWNVQIALREALREHAMREVQRLGQEIEQEPWCMKMNGCKIKCEDCPVEVVEPEQEPVAWINVEKRRLEFAEPMVWHTPTVVKLERIPLYTHQRTWVGLTDEEVKDIVWNLPYEPSQEHIRAIEAKLKEKNNAA